MLTAALLQGGSDGALVRLRYAPRARDTLHLVFDQRTELSSRPANSHVPDTAAVGRTTSGVRVFSRVIVNSSSPRGAVVTSIVDSVHVNWNDQVMTAMQQQMQKVLAGMATQLRIRPDGAVEVLSEHGAADVGLPMASPAMLPRKPVRVGDSWTGAIPVPAAGPLGPTADGSLQNTYYLDSLVGAGPTGGGIAWISVRGFFVPDSGGAATRGTTAGSVIGELQLDRWRGWITGSRLTILLRTQTPPADSTQAATVFDMRITQRVRAMDNRRGGG